MAEELEGYQANTVEELRDELRSRDLPISGHKDELVARLEEDDAATATEEEPSQEVAVREDEAKAAEENPDPAKRVYSPYELPANTAAAQAFIDTHPDAVDETVVLPDEQVAAAQATIQDHVDAMAAVGVTVEDPRLEGYSPPAPEPQEEPEKESA
jgi:hypothetical protein